MTRRRPIAEPKSELLQSLKEFETELRRAASRIRELRLDVELETSNRAGTSSPTWEEFLAAEHKPGHCAVCDRELSGHQRTMCGARECRRVFNTIYARGRRALKVAAEMGALP